MTLADRIVVMRNGLIEQVGTPVDIYSDPSSHFVADFFGSPSMNLIDGMIEQTGDKARFRGSSFAFDLPAAFAHTPAAPVTLGFRPEHLSVQPHGGDVQAEIRLVEPLGKDTLLYFEHGGDQPLIVVVEGTEQYRTGERLGLAFNPERLYLFDESGQRIRRR